MLSIVFEFINLDSRHMMGLFGRGIGQSKDL